MNACNEDWTVKVKGLMHKYRIKGGVLAERSGYSASYLSELLNGKRIEREKAKKQTKKKIFQALDAIIAEIEGSANENGNTD